MMDKRGLAYGKALYSCVAEKDLSRCVEYSEALLRLFSSSPDGLAFLSSPKIDKNKKKAVLSSLLSNADLPVLSACLYVMADNSDLPEIITALHSFLSLAYKALGIRQGTVYSARRMEEGELKRLIAAMEKKLGAEVRLHNKIDSSLLGGIKVALDEKTYDYTLKSQLDALRTRLKGGQ